jgi:hypothetical protein
MSLEGAAEVSLVAEARVQGDLRERVLRNLESVEGVLNAQPAHILSDRAAVAMAEGAHEVRWMNPCGGRHGFRGNLLGKVAMQEVRHCLKPAWISLTAAFRRATRQFRDQFQEQPFERERRQVIAA